MTTYTTKDAQNLELIRQKCIEANREIMELKFGCEIDGTIGMDEYFNQPYIVYGNTWICKKHKTYRVECMAEEDGCSGENGVEVRCGTEEDGWNEIRLEESKVGTIIGRPIRLSDVLLAIEKAFENRLGVSQRKFETLEKWNLRNDDLNDQSGETINFLAELFA